MVQPGKAKRGDTHLKNTQGIPQKIRDEYREDTHLRTVLDDNNVTNKSELARKIRNINKLEKFNQKIY